MSDTGIRVENPSKQVLLYGVTLLVLVSGAIFFRRTERTFADIV